MRLSILGVMVRGRVLCAVGAATVLFGLLPAHGAYATTACQGQSFQFDGSYVSANEYGASAVISSGAGALCGTAWSRSEDWVMLAGQGSTTRYAQSGQVRNAGTNSPVYFAEYNNDFGKAVYKAIGNTDTNSHSYYEVYNFAPGNVTMWKDGTSILTTNFDPIIAWGGMVPEFFGETHDSGDDMPGGFFIPAQYSSMSMVTSRTSGWVSTTQLTSRNTNSARYAEGVGTSSMNIWTN